MNICYPKKGLRRRTIVAMAATSGSCLALASVPETNAKSPTPFASVQFWANSFLPENTLDREDPGPDFTAGNGIDESLFNAIIQRVSLRFCPVFESYGVTCQIDGDWESSIVNAYAMRYGGAWLASVYGGLARRRELTPDGLTAVLCHEVGHHIAGYAFKSFVLGDNWAATEGQSDYFAAHACLPELWKDETDVNASFRGKVSPQAQKSCDAAWPEQKRRDLCYRIAAAALSDTTMIARATGVPTDPSFATPSQEKVAETNENHPKPQCRLDTQFSAALCNVDFDFSRVPGDKLGVSNRSIEAERDAMTSSCFAAAGHATGARPACWFVPLVK